MTADTLTSGEYHDVVVDCVAEDGAPVRRGALRRVRTDAGDRYWCLLEASDRTLEPGTVYELTGALGYDPTGESVPPAVAAARGGEYLCPDCGEPAEFRPDLAEPTETAAAAIAEAGVDELVLVVAEQTRVQRRRRSGQWSFPDGIGAPSRGTPERRQRRTPAEELGTFVCTACGHETDQPDRPTHDRRTLPDQSTRETGTETGTGSEASHAEQAIDTAKDVLDSVAPGGDAAAGTNASAAPMDASAAPGAADGSVERLGMATGGAKDVTNFRDSVAEGYLPRPEAVSEEGLFYDYYFDTGTGAASDGLFYPTYSAAVSEHPLTGERERHLTVGLNSTLTADDFERPPLDLVAVVDVSGSMSSPFDQYYYDEHGDRRTVEEPDVETKMAAARASLAALTEQFDDDDRLGVVLFNDGAGVAKPLRAVGDTDMAAVRSHVREIEAGGGTNVAAGFETARELLASHAGDADREQRVVFMSDAMPNVGTTDEDDLVDLVSDAAGEGVHTTFVGIGLDANSELIDALSGVRGANHYVVHSAAEFERRLSEEFEFVVTPLVFDLSVDVIADGYEIDAVHGSPNADRATGEVMHVTTLFPSPTEDGRSRGSVVLLTLRETGDDPEIELEASWERRDGTVGRDTVSVALPDEADSFESTGIRKAVLLARYAGLLREWIEAVRSRPEVEDRGERDAVDDWQPGPGTTPGASGEWEQESVPLAVPDPYGERCRRFREHLLVETAAIGDEDLQREADLLETLIETR